MKRYSCTTTQPPWHSWQTSSLKAKVYNHIKSIGDKGANRREIATAVNLNVGRVSSYLAELKRAGLIKRLGDQIDPTTLSVEDAALFAMNAMENALVIRATKRGITQEMDKAFIRYNKIKSLFIGGKTDGEVSAALRASLIDLIKLTF